MSSIFFRWAAKCGAAAVIAAPILVSTPALATIYVYDQTSASVPGLLISASITVNGDLSNLPHTSSTSNPIDFGNLLAFALSAPNALGISYTLSEFVAPQTIGPDMGFPKWTIDPGPNISFISGNDLDQFTIMGGNIAINSDYDAICPTTGACTAHGNWDPVSEPPSLAMLAVGAIWLSAAGGRRRQSSAR